MDHARGGRPWKSLQQVAMKNTTAIVAACSLDLKASISNIKLHN